MFCPAQTDPFLTALQAVGYNVIRLPRQGVHPLEILVRNGRDLTRLGVLSDLMTLSAGGTPIPAIDEGRAAGISGQRTSDLSVGIGLSLLGGIIGAMGGSKIGLDAKYSRATSIAFEFTDVLEEKISAVILDSFLGNAHVNESNVTLKQMLDADEVFITTAILKSAKFTVEAKQSDGASLEVSVPAIQEVVSSNIKVAANSQATTKITFEGNTPLAFGFQAVQLYYTSGTYSRFRPSTGAIAMKSPEPAVDAELASQLLVAGALIRIR